MRLLSEEFKNNKKKTLLIKLSVLIGLIALMVFFTFFDLQASKLLYYNNSVFGKVFSQVFFTVGFVPAIIVDTILFACAFWLVKNKGLKVLFAFLTVSTMAGALYTVFESFDGISKGIIYGVMGGGGLVLSGITIWLVGKLNQANLKKMFYVFLIAAIMATITIIIMAPMQQFWGRTRYYSIVGGNGSFTQWFLPQGIDKTQAAITRDFRSFPSMHASSVASMVVLIMIAWKFEFKKVNRVIMTSIAVVIIFCVCISRVVMGWHYMTDVIFGLLVPFLCFEIAVIITDRIYRKRALKEQSQITN